MVGEMSQRKVQRCISDVFLHHTYKFCHSPLSHGHFSGKDSTLRAIVKLNEINLVRNVFVHDKHYGYLVQLRFQRRDY
jgi:hypothetical protein